MKTNSDKLIIFLFKALAHLPVWFLYLMADFGCLILFHIINYRKKVVYANQAIVFVHTWKLKRGRYETTFSCLFENPAQETPEHILLSYIDKLEEIIRNEPEYWLWSHRRWKHTRPEGIELIDRRSATVTTTKNKITAT